MGAATKGCPRLGNSTSSTDDATLDPHTLSRFTHGAIEAQHQRHHTEPHWQVDRRFAALTVVAVAVHVLLAPLMASADDA